MPARKTNNKASHDGPKAVVVFWIIFVVVIISIALFNWETITRNFNLFKTRLTAAPGTEEALTEEEIDEITADDNPAVIILAEPAPKQESPASPAAPAATQPAQPDNQPIQPSTQTAQPQLVPQVEPQAAPSSEPPEKSAEPAASTSAPPPAAPPVQTRERAIYFVQVNNDGQILQSKVTRRLPASETPMQDVINAMLAGPSAAELRGNNLNLIPQNTRLLSAAVRGSTAYLNFSEDFMFNTFGVEGYVAQLRQIVWTATEFPNVRDVQILIEGRRVDYLAEGIWIGSPIGRQ